MGKKRVYPIKKLLCGAPSEPYKAFTTEDTEVTEKAEGFSPHLTFPIRERDLAEISTLSLESEDQSPPLSSTPRFTGSGEGR
ncbi:MAG: hypothetical protein JSV70_00025 [bacterium]|nr:MAG: hypothetical protein JSV70_00025 [bacterium]